MPTWVAPILDFLHDAITIIAHVTAIGAYGIAIYVFIYKRKDISYLFQLLLNYSRQLSLSDLKEKLEKLAEYDADNPKDKREVINILSEIQGHMLGNEQLKVHFADLEQSIDKITSDEKQLTESRKRKFASEAKEKLRHLSVVNLDAMATT